jgi:DNA-binding Lrp family transcriptional regulator
MLSAAAPQGALVPRLLDEFQRDFPLVPRPFAALAERLGTDEATVLDLLAQLRAAGAVSRVGAIVAPHAAGYSTLAAMAVPPDMLDGVAELVSSFQEVNHNYEREHQLNLWFVVAAASRDRVRQVLAAIEYRTSLPVIDLPLVEAYRLDLGFPLR